MTMEELNRGNQIYRKIEKLTDYKNDIRELTNKYDLLNLKDFLNFESALNMRIVDLKVQLKAVGVKGYDN